MIRKLFLLVLLLTVSLAPASDLAATCELEYPCDTFCGAEDETVCDCPLWTDRRVDQATCGTWNHGADSCWYLE